MPEVSPLIRFFVSSTFAEFAFEREVLQRTVFPRLRSLCAAQGCRFQPIDLRWGVSEEAGNNKQTLAICLAEIARCQRLSPDLNLLILLGDRYGSCFLPESIPSDQVARLLPQLAPAEQTAFTQAYKEDLNALPPEFVLLPGDRSAATKQGEESLRQALARAAQSADFSEQELLPFVASATHLEIQRGLLDANCDPAAAICAIRTLDTPPSEQQPQLQALKAAAEKRLNDTHIWRYKAQSEFNGLQAVEAARQHSSASLAPTDPQLREASAHYDALAEQFYALLKPRIQQALAWRQSAAQARDPGAEANRQFAESRASLVVGREDALKTVASYLAGQMPLPLVVTGESGVGKSTLLARAVEDARRAHPNAIIITRYIGVTPGTSSLADLLTGLRREIAERYGLPESEPVVELSQLVAAVATQLGTLEIAAERPLFLIIDALDQLEPTRQRVDWLPPKLAPNVRIVVSVLSDREELADLRARLPLEQLLQLAPLTRAQGAEILRVWLAGEGRKLTPGQETAVLDGFAPEPTGSGTPLYLRLAAEQARAWRSFDPVTHLPPTVPALIQSYFTELEQSARHGYELVAYALGDLAAAKHGLAEDELLDLLSRSKAVREGLHRLSPNAPPIEPQLPLPMALWALLAADVEHYLTDREADGARLITFYHRQVREEAERRYLNGSDRVARHVDLAAYFGEREYYLSAETTRVWNPRKLAEIAYHQAHAGPDARVPLETTLTDGRFLEGKLAVEGIPALLDDLALAPGSERVVKIAAAVREGALVIAAAPAELVNQINGRMGPIDHLQLHHLPVRTTPWLRLRFQSLNLPDSALRHILQGHIADVTACALSADGRMALSASHDGTLRVWDTASGQTTRILRCQGGALRGCTLSRDGRLAIALSEKGTLQLWDTVRGETVWVHEDDKHRVTRCAISADGRRALTASADRALRVWNAANGELLQILTGHTGRIESCALNENGTVALSASADGTLRVWDTDSRGSGQARHILKGFLGSADCCSLSADGGRAFSVSGGSLLGIVSHSTLRVWDTLKGKTRRVLRGHRGLVLCCALSADGKVALTGSAGPSLSTPLREYGGVISLLGSLGRFNFEEASLRVWDVDTGRTLQVLRGHSGGVAGCALSADGTMALSYSEPDVGNSSSSPLSHRSLRLWNTNVNVTGKKAGHSREGHTGMVTGCALSADGQLALSASVDRTLRLWDTTTGKTVKVLEGHSGAEGRCALSADGRIALFCANGGEVRQWDTTTGRILSQQRHGPQRLTVHQVAALSTDWRLVLMPTTPRLRSLSLWDVNSGRELRRLEGEIGQLEHCALSGDGRRALAVSKDKMIGWWDTASGRILGQWQASRGTLTDCKLSANGELTLTAFEESALKLWETSSEVDIAYWAHDHSLVCCALSGDGRLAVAGDSDGGVHILDVVGMARATVIATKGTGDA